VINQMVWTSIGPVINAAVSHRRDAAGRSGKDRRRSMTRSFNNLNRTSLTTLTVMPISYDLSANGQVARGRSE
jgi:hypothetical protein